MKRIVLVVLCLLLLGTGLFARERNWGLQMGSGMTSYGSDTSVFELGFGAFFGINRFVEINIGASVPLGYVEVEQTWWGGSGTYYESEIYAGGGLNFGVYGKFPFPIGRVLVLYPLGGAEFDLIFGDIWSTLHVRFGAGIDIYPGTRNFFLRFNALFGPSIPLITWDYDPDGAGFGFIFKIGIGWMRG